jgi:hypothetical protein
MSYTLEDLVYKRAFSRPDLFNRVDRGPHEWQGKYEKHVEGEEKRMSEHQNEI